MAVAGAGSLSLHPLNLPMEMYICRNINVCRGNMFATAATMALFTRATSPVS
jgi:hypothetical protein